MQIYQQNTDSLFKESCKMQIMENELNNLNKKLDKAIKWLKESGENGNLPLFSESYSALNDDNQINVIQSYAESLKKDFKNFIILGTGGSTLCAQAICNLSNNQDIRLQFLPNIDSTTIANIHNSIDYKSTHFLVISKSGGTLETISQFLFFYARTKEILNNNISEHFTIITDPNDNPLRDAAKNKNIKILEHEAKIGGRFSILTNVALLPAFLIGLDAEKVRKGANDTLLECYKEQYNSKPSKGAAINYLLENKGISSSVMMPYIDRLLGFTQWYRQIWAESLGKNGYGTTPISALGTLDQHSQLQLYLDGKPNKFFNFIGLSNKTNLLDKLSTDDFDQELWKYLSGKSFDKLIQSCQNGTEQALINRGLPVRSFVLQNLDEYSLGGLIMHFILETSIIAFLRDIDPFNQPAVEESKIISRSLLHD